MIEIKTIPISEINEYWPFIEHWVIESTEEDKSFSSEDIRKLCLSGKVELRIIYNPGLTGFFITMIFDTPQMKVAHGTWLGGKDLGDWVKPVLEQLKEHLKSIGCKQFTWFGRKAWAKMINADHEQIYYLIRL